MASTADGSRTRYSGISSHSYDGFRTVQDPQQYLEAPPMLMMDVAQARTNFDPTFSTLVSDSIAFCQSFRILSPEELHKLLIELKAVGARLEDASSQLEVEQKMREAAGSISRLHMENSTQTNKEARLSRLFSPGKDRRRLSKQVDDELEVSATRIDRLLSVINELLQRKNHLETLLLEHHSAVLLRAFDSGPSHRVEDGFPVRPDEFELDDQPIPTANGGSSKNLGYSEGAATQPPASQRGLHARNRSSLSTIGNIRPHPANFENREWSNNDLSDELKTLANRVSEALPSVTPNPNKISYITAAFDSLLRESSDKGRQLEVLQSQADQAEERIGYLTKELRSEKATNASEEVTAAKVQDKAVTESYEHQLQEERARALYLKDCVDVQKKELERVLASLEDVTQLAVNYETMCHELDVVIASLENQVKQLTAERVDHVSQHLDDSGTSSTLCKSFRSIIHDLTQQNYRELQALRSKRLEKPNSAVSQLLEKNTLENSLELLKQNGSDKGPRQNKEPRQQPRQVSSGCGDESSSAPSAAHSVSKTAHTVPKTAHTVPKTAHTVSKTAHSVSKTEHSQQFHLDNDAQHTADDFFSQARKVSGPKMTPKIGDDESFPPGDVSNKSPSTPHYTASEVKSPTGTSAKHTASKPQRYRNSVHNNLASPFAGGADNSDDIL